MYSMKNGILYQDDKPVFCVGLSYYPSYHAKKVPVPEDGDRVGEMIKDIRGMKEAGFNLVRAASIGDVRRVNGEIEVHTEFIEQLLDECDKVDIASMMRLQGYSMNLSGYDDFLMLDEEGNEIYTAGVEVNVKVPVSAGKMSDDTEAGGTCGNIISLIYKGDHYHYIVRTKSEEDIHLHDEFLWNEEDYVSIIIPKESIRLTLKAEKKDN